MLIDFTQRVIKNFDRRKLEVVSIETFPNIDEIEHEEQREDVSTITPEEEELPPLASAEVPPLDGALAYL